MVKKAPPQRRKRTKNTPLSSKEERFVLAFIKTGNKTQAAIEAGYSEKTACQSAARVFRKVNVKNRIAELKKEFCEEVGITVLDVLAILKSIGQFSVKDVAEYDGTTFKFKPLDEWPEGAERAIASIKQSTRQTDFGVENVLDIKFESKLVAAKALGDYLGMFTGYDQLVRAAAIYGKELVDAKGV